ncbi:MAG TPA: DUF885 domain-containing protein [Acidimicrobiia bacterium]|nr:DUF885 domain-containing protein [Acidimicrobiia bacterium]
MTDTVASLAARFWDLQMETSPTWAALVGDHRFDDRLETADAGTEAEHLARFREILTATKALPEAELTAQDRITRDVLVFETQAQIDDLVAGAIEHTIDPMLGIQQTLVGNMPLLTPQTAEHAEAYVAKAAQVGRLIDETIGRHRDGAAKGRTAVRALAAKVVDQLDAYLNGTVESDPFMRIAPPPSFSESETEAWRSRMAEVVRSVVRPAAARYREAVVELLPGARPNDQVGMMHIPGGPEAYERAVWKYTSTDLTPDEIHEIGLTEIRSLEEEYRELGSEVLGTSDVGEIYERLRHDPELRFETAAQVKEAAELALERANAAVPDWFGVVPATPCIVEEVPEIGAEDQTIAYYMPPAPDGSRPGIHFINTHAPTTRTRFESEALAFHESVPGHHLQLALAQEMTDLPEFRRHAQATAYIEGWGLYTERLADEMGLYSSPVARLGILSFDSWRACRLVVDTGLHTRGWSRQQAVDFMASNSPQAPNNIVNEVDRYIGYYGQALAYKIGQREILRLRAEARDAMGDRFDIKGFHDVALTAGPVPLGVLARLVGDWISA